MLFEISVIVCIAIIKILFHIDFRYFVDSISLLILLVSYAIVIMYTHSLVDFIYPFKIIVSKNNNQDNDQVTNSMKLYKLLQKSSYVIGLLGFLFSAGLALIKYTNVTNLMFHLLISSLVLLYGVIMNLIFIIPVQKFLSKFQHN